jgi:hypothetical protein
MITRREANLSKGRAYRYTLIRQWAEEEDFIAFIGLNPSTANEKEDDPTVRRCIAIAKMNGFDGLVMLNLFAYRTKSPRILFEQREKKWIDIIGFENNHYLKHWIKKAYAVVCCWGVQGGKEKQRAKDVYKMINYPMCLGLTKEGYPKHPLYLQKDISIKPYKMGSK